MGDENKFIVERIEAFAYDNFLCDWGSAKLKKGKALTEYYLERYLTIPERRDSVVCILQMMVKFYSENGNSEGLSGKILFPKKLKIANEILSKTPLPK